MRRVLLALGRAKTQLVVALAFSVAAALSPPQAAAQDECPGVVYGQPNTEDYYLVNKATRMLAEVFAHNTAEKAPVVLWRRYGSNNSERFRIARYPLSYGNPCEEQWFTIQAVHSGKYLATDGSKSGAKVVQSTHVSDWARQWRVKLVRLTAEECPSGRCFAAFRHVLENYYDRGRRCLDAANGKFPRPPVEGSALQAFDCIPKFSSPNAVNQEWEVVRAVIWDSSR